MPGARGEVTIETDTRTLSILFTNRALAEAENTMGRSIIAVAQGFASGDSALSISELAQMLRSGMEAARRDAKISGRVVSMNDAFDVLDEVGFTRVAQAVFGAISVVLSYDSEAEESEGPNS